MSARSIDNHARREEIRSFDLLSYQILDTPAEESFDDLAQLATTVCAAPIALITFIDAEREWFKARIGVGQRELPRHLSLCARAIDTPLDLTLIEDVAARPEFEDNAFNRASPAVRFYAGAPLVTPVGCALGTLCVMDVVPRSLTLEQRGALKALARQVVSQLELRRLLTDLSGAGGPLARSHRAAERRGEQSDSDLKAPPITTRDPVTKLPDRSSFDALFADAVKTASKRSESLALIVIGIDHFKSVAQQLSDAAARQLLHALARRLQEVARRGDLVARFADAHFAVFCPGISESLAYAVAQRFRLAVREVAATDRLLTASVGVAALCVDALTATEMTEAAEKALIAAESAGHDRVVRYSNRIVDSYQQS